jgi:endonuclease YncB( thermonuclease family)
MLGLVMANKLLVLTIFFVVLALGPGFAVASAYKFEKTAIVITVIDGDTIILGSGETVRFADIDTPEVDEAGYQAAKDYVSNLVSGKTVYLDVDNISRTDPYERLVCVVYSDYNSTHYQNLNKALLDSKLAVLFDFNNNEFSPNNWELFLPKQAIPEFPLIPLLLAIIIPVSLLLIKRKKEGHIKYLKIELYITND